MDDGLAFASATDLLELISTKQISPVELTELYFDRIDRLDSQLNAFLLLTRDEAMEAAKAAEAAVVRGDELGVFTRTAYPHQGHPNDQGDRDDFGFGGIHGPYTGAGFSRCGARAGSWGHHLGQDQCSGVRHGRHL